MSPEAAAEERPEASARPSPTLAAPRLPNFPSLAAHSIDNATDPFDRAHSDPNAIPDERHSSSWELEMKIAIEMLVMTTAACAYLSFGLTTPSRVTHCILQIAQHHDHSGLR